MCAKCDKKARLVQSVRQGVIVFAVIAMAIYVIGWLVNIDQQTAWSQCEKVVKIEPVGHKYDTSYFLTGESGVVQDSLTPVSVGQEHCFASNVTFDAKPFLSWWK